MKRNKKMSIIILISIIVILTGCVEDKKQIEKNNVSEKIGSFITEKGVKEGPNTPVTISLEVPSNLRLNIPTELTINVKSVDDANETKVDLTLPDGVELLSGESSWTLDLKANEPQKLKAQIKLTKEENLEIKAVAKKVIDQENVWGDMDIMYINYQGEQSTKAYKEE